MSSIPGVYALLYAPGRLIVKGDAAATAERLRTSQTLFRTALAAELVGTVLFVFVALVLYRLFKPVSEGNALSMLVLILISFPISLFNVLNEIVAMYFAGGGRDAGFLSALDGHQRESLAYLGIRMHAEGIMVAQIFWGLWLIPFAVCVIRSGFIPRFLGVLLIIAGPGYIADSLAVLVFPQYIHAVEQVTRILTACELPIIFWLLIWGARPQRAGAPTD